MGEHRHTVNCCTVAAYTQGRDEERARVVAYLRASGYEIVPAEIERGEHDEGGAQP